MYVERKRIKISSRPLKRQGPMDPVHRDCPTEEKGHLIHFNRREGVAAEYRCR